MSTARARIGTVREQPRLTAFYVVTILFGGFFVFAFHQPFTYVVTSFLPDFHEPAHRIHTMMIGGIFLVFTLGILAQLYRPIERVGALLGSILLAASVTVIGLALVGPSVLDEILLLIVAAVLVGALHPARSTLFSGLAVRDTRLLAVAVVGAIAFFGLAALEANHHLTAGDGHVEAGHYMLMTAGAVTVALAALGAAVHPTGWRALAFVAAFLAIVPFGLGMLAFPGGEQGSTVPTLVAVGVIVWAIALVGVAEYVDRVR